MTPSNDWIRNLLEFYDSQRPLLIEDYSGYYVVIDEKYHCALFQSMEEVTVYLAAIECNFILRQLGREDVNKGKIIKNEKIF